MTLLEAAIAFECTYAPSAPCDRSEGQPHLTVPSRVAFMAGAAAMAEQVAQGHGTLALMVKELCILMTREAQRLNERMRMIEQCLPGDDHD